MKNKTKLFVPKKRIDISLIICTRNRAAILLPHLDSLAKIITHSNFLEIIIVDNGSADSTPDILADFAAKYPDVVSIMREEAPGLSRARNTGYKMAKGDIVVFTDDDCYPNPDFIEKIASSFRTNGWDYLGGRVNLFDPLDAPVTIKTDTELFAISPKSHIETGILHGANLSFKKFVLDYLNGFDTRFGAGTSIMSAEDTDVLARASAAGFSGGYDPGPTVAHHHRRQKKEDIEKINAGYDMGRGAYYAKMILVSEVRFLYLKHWYWRCHLFTKNRAYSRILRELRGAAKFYASEIALHTHKKILPVKHFFGQIL